MYRDYASYIKEKFGSRVQKIALNPGFGCPNRDGKIGTGGCTYCNNSTFSPFYGKAEKAIEMQLDEGIKFFSNKYKCDKFIAYFQSYTNTYADTETLWQTYSKALEREDVVGLAVATRPDCVGDDVLEMLGEIARQGKYTSIEIGVESCYNKTLEMINRGHTFEQAADAIVKAHSHGIEVCAHMIMFLPGESREMMMQTADVLSALPITTLKLHQLQIIRGTKMERQWRENPELFCLPDAEEYAEFCARYALRVRKDMIFERFVSESPRNMLVAPIWNGLKGFEISEKIKNYYKKICSE